MTPAPLPVAATPPDRERPPAEASHAQDGQDRAARVTWSLIAEPSDAIAMLACALLGPAAALDLAERGGHLDLLRALGGELPTDAASPSRHRVQDRARQALDRWRRRLEVVRPQEVHAAAHRRGIRVVVPGDAEWPPALSDLQETAPHCLWVQGPGNLAELVGSRSVALVGARASTAYGEQVAGRLAADFAAGDGTVVSGGAYGIDAAAHRGALAAPSGATVAVLAGGLDRLYPRLNEPLLERIRDRHLLVSEAPPGTDPTRWRFLARNRLIAALSQATVVVEAGWRSGALSTARRADDLSRPVGAVPGSVESAASAGCHRLIRERGAVLVTDVSEMLDLLPGGPAAGEGAYAVQDELDLLSPADRRVLDAVPPRSSITESRIVQEIGFSPQEVAGAIARLALLGLVVSAAGRIRRLRDTP